MNNQNKFSRRQFLQVTGVGVGGICLLANCGNSISIWRFFSNTEAKLMDAIADQIIPPDDWPGGSESGVTNFIDKQLVGPYVRFQQDYRKGLLAIHDSCNDIYNKQFEELDWNEQTAFLEKMEAGKMHGNIWSNGFDKTFFSLCRDHAMQAYYGSSRHGGNRNNKSYQMLELDYPLIIGQNRYKS